MEKNIQDIQFELMEHASFNNFDGRQVVASLKKNPDLWKGVVMDRADYCTESHDGFAGPIINLIKLRDIGENYWNVDTLFVLPKGGKEDELEKLANAEWGADEVGWVGGKEAAGMLGASSLKNDKQILRVWFD